jgi:hypothetical protein
VGALVGERRRRFLFGRKDDAVRGYSNLADGGSG